MNYYNYLFYKFYQGAFLINEKGDPEFRAIFGMGITEGINFYSFIQIFLYFVSDYPINIPTILLAILTIAVFIINYFLFIHKNKFKVLIKTYENESKKQRFISNILTWAYVIITFVLLFYAKDLQFRK